MFLFFSLNNQHSFHFRYQPIARSTVASTKLPELFASGKLALKKMLTQQQAIPLTTDTWSDRKMRSFLGVTAHIIGKINTIHTNTIIFIYANVQIQGYNVVES